MKHSKRFLSLSLICCMMVAYFCSGFGTNVAKAATDEVSYYSSSKDVVDAGGGYSLYEVKVQVKVKNIAYDKAVTLHYKNNITGEWVDNAAHYCYSLDDNYEIWEGSVYYWSMPGYVQFAIKYEVAGQTYWDNNDNNDYIIQ